VIGNCRSISIHNKFPAFSNLLCDHITFFLSTDLILLSMSSTNIILPQPIYLINSIVPSVSTQEQTAVVCLRNAFDTDPHNLHNNKLSNFIYTSGFFSYFHSYLMNGQSFVHTFSIHSFSHALKFRVPRGSTLGLMLFNTLMISVTLCLILSASSLG
jgi:hypothetical protein